MLKAAVLLLAKPCLKELRAGRNFFVSRQSGCKSEETIQFIIDSVNDLLRLTEEYVPFYNADPAVARFKSGLKDIPTFLNPLRQV